MAKNEKTCFVIMRFDEPYEERCERIYIPAIKAAGLVPHLAGGPGTGKITLEMEEGIRNAHICLADISEDNLNVWYELGFAYACNKHVVVVSDQEKRSADDLPFDTRDSWVIFYDKSVDSNKHARKGFQLEITEDAKAKAAKVVAPVVGGGSVVSPQSQGGTGGKLPEGWDEMDREVFKEIVQWVSKYGRPLRERQGDLGGYALLNSFKSAFQAKASVNKLIGKGLIDRVLYEDRDGMMGEVYDGLVLTSAGEEFASKHSELLV